jgi:hypothetical protein
MKGGLRWPFRPFQVKCVLVAVVLTAAFSPSYILGDDVTIDDRDPAVVDGRADPHTTIFFCAAAQIARQFARGLSAPTLGGQDIGKRRRLPWEPPASLLSGGGVGGIPGYELVLSGGTQVPSDAGRPS